MNVDDNGCLFSDSDLKAKANEKDLAQAFLLLQAIVRSDPVLEDSPVSNQLLTIIVKCLVFLSHSSSTNREVIVLYLEVFYFNLCMYCNQGARDIKVIQVYGQSQVGPQGVILDSILQFKEMQQSMMFHGLTLSNSVIARTDCSLL